MMHREQAIKRYYLLNAEIKNFNVMIDRKTLFNKPIKNNTTTYENIRKITTGHRDGFTAVCLLDYAYFRDIYKMIAVDLSKQQALDSDRKAIQQINFAANLDRAGNTRIFFLLEKSKRNHFGLFIGNCKSIGNVFH